MKKILIAIAVIFAVFVVAVLIVAGWVYPYNFAETSEHSKELRTRNYGTDIPNAAAKAAEIIPTLSSWGSNWKLVDKEIGTNSAVIKAEVPVVVFTDDFEVRITDSARENRVIVNVRSKSRVGKSDFGENYRHIAKFLEALDQQLLGSK